METGSTETEINADETISITNDSNIRDVRFPSEFFAFDDEEEIKNYCDEMGYEGYMIDSDGNVTLRMTNEKAEEVINYIHDELIGEFNSYVDEVDSITAIECNDSLTEINIRFNEYGNELDNIIYAFGICYSCAVYSQILGIADDDIDVKVNFIDDATGEITDSTSYKDLNELINSPSVLN